MSYSMLIPYGEKGEASGRPTFQRMVLVVLVTLLWYVPGSAAAGDLRHSQASIQSVSPKTLQAGDVLTIRGRHLNTSGAIRIQQDACAIISWTDHAVTCRVPATITEGSSRVELTTATRDYVEGPKLRFVAHPPMERASRSPYLSRVGTIGVASIQMRHDGDSPREIVLSGHGFGNERASSHVLVRGMAAEVVSWSDRRIVFHAPIRVLSAGWHDVVLSIRALHLDAGQFGIRPHVDSVALDSSAEGTAVILRGASFGEAIGPRQVVLGDVEQGIFAEIVRWSATEIVATLPPSLPAGTDSISVWVHGIGGNRMPLNVAARISGIRPQAAYPGQEVTIHGANFNSRHVDDIQLDGSPVRVVGWSTDSIRVIVPEGVRSGRRRLVVSEDRTAPLSTNLLVLQKTQEQADPRWDAANIDHPW